MHTITRYQLPRTACYPITQATRYTPLNWVNDFFADSFSGFSDLGLQGRFPVSLEDAKDSVVVRVELPGVPRDAIVLEAEGGQLSIRASVKRGETTEAFSRSVSLPETLDLEKAAATYENGVLLITLPKLERTKPRTITIN